MPSNQTQINSFVTSLSSVQASGPVFTMIQALSRGVGEDSALLAYLQQNAKRDWKGGGNVNWNITTAERNAVTYGDSTTFDVSKIEYKKQATLPRAYYVNPAVYSYKDYLENYGPDRMQNFVAEQLDIAKQGMANRIMLDIYGNGTLDANGGVAGGNTTVVNPIIGLGLAVETTPTSSSSTYGGHTRTSSTSWLNNNSTSITNLASLTYNDLMTMYQKCNHLGMGVDLICVSEPAFRQIFSIVKAEQQYSVNAKAVEMGFPDNINFKNAAIIPDKFLTGTADGGYLSSTLKRIYFLSTKGFEYKVDPNDDMKVDPMIVKPSNQMVYVQDITWSGQMCVTHLRNQGVIYWS